LDLLLAYKDVYGNLIIFSNTDKFNFKVTPSQYRKVINFQPVQVRSFTFNLAFYWLQYPTFFSEDSGTLQGFEGLGDSPTLSQIKTILGNEQESSSEEKLKKKKKNYAMEDYRGSVDIPRNKLKKIKKAKKRKRSMSIHEEKKEPAKAPSENSELNDKVEVNEPKENGGGIEVESEELNNDDKVIISLHIDEENMFELTPQDIALLDSKNQHYDTQENMIDLTELATDCSLINGMLNNLAYFLEKVSLSFGPLAHVANDYCMFGDRMETWSIGKSQMQCCLRLSWSALYF
jgi:hypothetical protein